MTRRIEVTASDIAEGRPQDSCKCPIALACIRAGYANPEVDGITVDSLTGSWRLPSEAQAFVDAFDAGRPVLPFAFELEEREP